MKAGIIVVSVLVLTLFACTKENFETKPSIEIISVSSEIVPANSDVRFSLVVRDKEGDVDSALYIVRQRINKLGPKTTTLKYIIPAFPDKSKVDMDVRLSYINDLTFNLNPLGPQSQYQNDTLDLKFVAKDQKNNASDTVTKRIIVIRKS